MKIEHCLRCEGSWCFRGMGRALRCGVCGSPYWDQERKKGGVSSDGRAPREPDGEILRASSEVAGSTPVPRSKISVGAEVANGAGLAGCEPEASREQASMRKHSPGSSILPPQTKPDIAELRAICAGDVPRPATVFGGYAAAIKEHLEEEISAPACSACEGSMRQVKGKWACVDQACGMCGVEQKLKRQK